MTELHDPTREDLEVVVTDLVKRHGGPTAVGKAVSASRYRVHAWMKGDITLQRLGEVAYALNESVVLRFGPKEESAAPSLTRRLLAGVMALEEKLGIDESAIDRMMTRVEAMESAARETDERIAAELAQSQRKSVARARGRGDGQSAGSKGSKRPKR